MPGRSPSSVRAAPPEPGLHQELERARYLGFRGGFISRHRALLFSPLDRRKLASAAALTLATLLLWHRALGLVSRFWQWTLDFCSEVLGLYVVTRQVAYEVAGTIRFEVPFPHVPAGPPTLDLWWLGAIACALLAAVSFLMPRRLLPLAYGLRIGVTFQVLAQLFFALWPDEFPYTAGGYIHTMLIAGLVVITLVPVVLAFTYYLFDFTLGQKIALTLAMMFYLTVMIPLQYQMHAYVLYHLSLLFLPILFFLFGLALNVLAFIALFGWGFSWRSHLHDLSVQWRARRRFV